MGTAGRAAQERVFVAGVNALARMVGLVGFKPGAGAACAVVFVRAAGGAEEGEQDDWQHNAHGFEK